MSEFKFPTEEVELPSKGLIYPKDNPLSSGKIEMKYMTAKEEDILTNQNYIKQGNVIDKLLKSLIIDKSVNYDDMIVGDKNAVLIAARILGYGKDYDFKYKGETTSVDLTALETTYLEESSIVENKNEFTYILPHTSTTITYKILTNRDEKKIEAEVRGLQKLDKQSDPTMSTRLKYMILSVNGDSDNKVIRDFVDNYMLARDSRSFREHIRETQPDIQMKFMFIGIDSMEEDATIPMTAGFLWPESGI
jgi:hypothetical protein|tara:strand:- start:10760 stop:11506 length:747 start_codon:yes stop_codon:yes gene_type:complete